VEAKGAGTAKTLTEADLLQLQDIWGLHVPAYGVFRARFATMNRRLHRNRRINNINDWQPNAGTREEKKWQTMGTDIVVRTPPPPLWDCSSL
jgi:hypothetical protein